MFILIIYPSYAHLFPNIFLVQYMYKFLCRCCFNINLFLFPRGLKTYVVHTPAFVTYTVHVSYAGWGSAGGFAAHRQRGCIRHSDAAGARGCWRRCCQVVSWSQIEGSTSCMQLITCSHMIIECDLCHVFCDERTVHHVCVNAFMRQKGLWAHTTWSWWCHIWCHFSLLSLATLPSFPCKPPGSRRFSFLVGQYTQPAPSSRLRTSWVDSVTKVVQCWNPGVRPDSARSMGDIHGEIPGASSLSNCWLYMLDKYCSIL